MGGCFARMLHELNILLFNPLLLLKTSPAWPFLSVFLSTLWSLYSHQEVSLISLGSTPGLLWLAALNSSTFFPTSKGLWSIRSGLLEAHDFHYQLSLLVSFLVENAQQKQVEGEQAYCLLLVSSWWEKHGWVLRKMSLWSQDLVFRDVANYTAKR